MTLRRHLCLLIAVAAALGGCANSAAISSGPAGQTVRVERKTSVLLLQNLRRNERYGLRDFIANASRGRRDALQLDVAGSPRLVAQVAHEARAMGIVPYNIRLSASPVDLPAHFGVRIEAITYEAHPAACPPFAVTGPSLGDNSFDPTLGCSVRNNLAVMVNDPGDLLGNSAVMPTSGDRAVLPITARGPAATGNRSNLEDGAQNKGAPETQ
ncbi:MULTISPECIES: CpaD family pilus assembly lipoprotein [Bradyrhizobium]